MIIWMKDVMMMMMTVMMIILYNGDDAAAAADDDDGDDINQYRMIVMNVMMIREKETKEKVRGKIN